MGLLEGWGRKGIKFGRGIAYGQMHLNQDGRDWWIDQDHGMNREPKD
ncbi:hypothetical protein [Sphingobacterium sp. LZ11T8]|nr:hypothetical protein [Sphingobacterium sp. LZ11T8]